MHHLLLRLLQRPAHTAITASWFNSQLTQILLWGNLSPYGLEWFKNNFLPRMPLSIFTIYEIESLGGADTKQ